MAPSTSDDLLTEADGPELVRLLNELTVRTHHMSLDNNLLQVNYHHDFNGTGWSVKTSSLGDEQSILVGESRLLDALRAEVTVLRDREKEEAKLAKKAAKSTRRRR